MCDKGEVKKEEEEQQQQQIVPAVLPQTPKLTCRVTPQSPASKVTAKKNLKQEVWLLAQSIDERDDPESSTK